MVLFNTIENGIQGDFQIDTANQIGQPDYLLVKSASLKFEILQRKYRNINGAFCNDLWITCCCPLCVLIQMKREADKI